MIALLITCAILGVTDGDTLRCETPSTRMGSVEITSTVRRGIEGAPQIARAAWGTPPCGEPTIVVEALPPTVAAEARIGTCQIAVSAQTIDSGRGCEAVVHELGHLSGLGHSDDPASIMRPWLAAHPWCETVTTETVALDPPQVLHRIRLAAIDAPETRPPCRWVGCCGGPEARARLRELLPVGLEVRVRVTGRDRYGRSVGYVWRGITPATARSAVNYRMVREGWARFYAAYPGRWPASYEAAGDRAEKARRGMWRWCNPTEGATT